MLLFGESKQFSIVRSLLSSLYFARIGITFARMTTTHVTTQGLSCGEILFARVTIESCRFLRRFLLLTIGQRTRLNVKFGHFWFDFWDWFLFGTSLDFDDFFTGWDLFHIFWILIIRKLRYSFWIRDFLRGLWRLWRWRSGVTHRFVRLYFESILVQISWKGHLFGLMFLRLLAHLIGNSWCGYFFTQIWLKSLNNASFWTDELISALFWFWGDRLEHFLNLLVHFSKFLYFKPFCTSQIHVVTAWAFTFWPLVLYFDVLEIWRFLKRFIQINRRSLWISFAGRRFQSHLSLLILSAWSLLPFSIRRASATYFNRTILISFWNLLVKTLFHVVKTVVDVHEQILYDWVHFNFRVHLIFKVHNIIVQ